MLPVAASGSSTGSVRCRGERALQNSLLAVGGVFALSALVMIGYLVWQMATSLSSGIESDTTLNRVVEVVRLPAHAALTLVALRLGWLARRHRGDISRVHGLKRAWIQAPLAMAVLMLLFVPWMAWVVLAVVVIYIASIPRVSVEDRETRMEGGSYG